MYTSKHDVPSAAKLPEQWVAWPVSWSAVWVGALAAVAASVIFGLAGAAAGVTSLEHVKDFSTWRAVSLIDTAVAIFAAFLAFVIGGWVTGTIAGIRRSEPAILHGVISWLVALPLMLALLAMGAGKAFGGWYGGIIGASPLAAGVADSLTADNIRHSAEASATAVLLGLIGAVIGGWIACGEPMSLTHHRTRDRTIGGSNPS